MGEFHKLNLYSNKYLEFESYFVVSTLFYSCLHKTSQFELISEETAKTPSPLLLI